MACGLLRGRGATVRVARTPASGVNAGLHLHLRMRVVRLAVGVQAHFGVACRAHDSREGWIAAGRALRRSGAVITAPPWLGRGQAWMEVKLAAG